MDSSTPLPLPRDGDAGPGGHRPDQAIAPRRLLAVAAAVFGAIAALAGVDHWLARLDQDARLSESRQLFSQGQRLAREGRREAALDQYRAALTQTPDNREYQLALVQMEQDLGRLDDAETALRSFLDKTPTDGQANLMMGRLLVARGHPQEAEWFYHRAVYGSWTADAAAHRTAVRFELADILARRGAQDELLAEALPLQDAAGQSVPALRRVAGLLLAAGAEARATGLYRELIRQNPRDAEAYSGIGDAAFAEGRYEAAQSAYLTASQLDKQGTRPRERLALCSQVLALDPTARRLGAKERLRRSRELLAQTLAAWDRCAAAQAAAPDAADEARSVLSSGGPDRRDDPLEANLNLAERLWRSRKNACTPAPGEQNEPLTLVMAKLAQ